MKQEDLLLYAVTDRHWLNGETLESQVERAIQGGATFIQLREKQLDEAAFRNEALAVQKVCRKYGVPFVINDNVELARQIGADGVHVGQSDMEALSVRKTLGEGRIIGVSAQTVEQAVLAERHGADYLGVGAVFPTGSKDDAVEVSRETLAAICRAVSIPVIAIGGITRDNVTELSDSGICGIAVISAIFGKPDIAAAARDLKRQTRKMLGARLQGVIFDVDGTLLDSMPMWDHAASRYLEGLGVTPEPDLQQILFPMSLTKAAEYLQEHYRLNMTVPEIMDGFNATIHAFYRDEALPKAGAEELLAGLRREGIPMTVATSTDRCHIEAAFARLGWTQYFEELLTCTEVGVGKVQPLIYQLAAEHMGTPVGSTWVFEDALHAAETAHRAGFPVAGVYDRASEANQERLRETAELYMKELWTAEQFMEGID